MTQGASRELEPGDDAPSFALEDGEGKRWELADLRGQKVILYFYPADDTPGCTAQACDFRDADQDLVARGYTVLGVSPQGAASHQRFTAKHSLNFPLLVDEDHSVAAAYGAWGTKKTFGKTYTGMRRSTFVIDGDGRIEVAQYDVKAKGHVERLLNTLESSASS